MNNFDVVKELRIGHIIEVSGTTIRVELDGDVAELSRSHAGRVYPIGQMGSIVKVHFGRSLVFGFVSLLRMRSEDLIEQGKVIPPEADQRIMEVELFAEGTWLSATDKLNFKRGVTTYPLPRQGVYLLTRDEGVALYSAAEGKLAEDGIDALVGFGTYVGAEGVSCRANIDKMFSMHCAVLGSTGSGKSGAVSALLHATLIHRANGLDECRPCIIVVDPHGEYGTAFGNRGVRYRAYDPVGNENAAGTSVALPYWLMSAEEFRLLTIGKTEREATSQHNVIYKALTHARMQAAGLVAASPTTHGGPAPTDGLPHDYPRPANGHTQEELDNFDRDKPRPFSLNELVNHIVYLQAARPTKTNVLESVPAGQFADEFKSILDKISVLRQDPRIRFMMKDWQPGDPSLGDIIGQFVGVREDDADIKVLDISGLPNEVAGPLTASLAQLLFRYKVFQAPEERERDPVLLVCEEAHRYVPDRGEAEYAAAQGAIRRIAREGRKYGLGLMLVSQRPADVESTVIAQCGTWLVLRLTNQADQQHVARFLPDGLSGMTKSLPNLGQQEAIFVGEGAALPARVRINDLTEAQLPQSRNARFAKGWSMDRLSKDELDVIANRMAG
ncbi:MULTISPECIES: ATP-binding protein [Luteibacter]|uniref:ATP-binding protein n=1 Tax=Luteibacter TaxID=242605 RepID=UPI00056ACC14|nr:MULTISPECIES: ATP-binding protein [unclassified Luteibacter]